MPTKKELKINGAVVFWQAASCSRDHMVAALAASLSKEVARSMVPPEDSNRRALKRAVADLYGAKQGMKAETLIRSSEEAITVVEEKVGASKNAYKTLHSFPIPVGSVESGDWEVAPADEIKKKFFEEKQAMSATVAGKVMKHYVEGALQATRVRPNGGVYWLPEDALASFTKFSNAVEKNTEIRVHVLRTVADAKAIRAIRTALETEVADLDIDIRQWIDDPSNKDKAFPRRFQNAADVLGEKMKSYAGELETSFSAAKVLETTVTTARNKAALVETSEKLADLVSSI